MPTPAITCPVTLHRCHQPTADDNGVVAAVAVLATCQTQRMVGKSLERGLRALALPHWQQVAA
jgi:hypothetical protein